MWCVSWGPDEPLGQQRHLFWRSDSLCHPGVQVVNYLVMSQTLWSLPTGRPLHLGPANVQGNMWDFSTRLTFGIHSISDVGTFIRSCRTYPLRMCGLWHACQVDFHFNRMSISILIIGCCYLAILYLNLVAKERSLICLVFIETVTPGVCTGNERIVMWFQPSWYRTCCGRPSVVDRVLPAALYGCGAVGKESSDNSLTGFPGACSRQYAGINSVYHE